MICKLNSLARSYKNRYQGQECLDCHEQTYLQAFYFSLESKNEVFHIAAVKAVLPLLFWGRWALGTWFIILDSGRQRQSWKPLLGQCDWLFLLILAFIWVSVLLLLLLLIIDDDWILDALFGYSDDASSFAIDDSCTAARDNDLILGQYDRCQGDGLWTGDNWWAKHSLRVHCHHIGRARWGVLGMVMMPGHTHCRLRDLTHPKVLKYLLLGCRRHSRDRRLLRCTSTGLYLLIFSGDLLLLLHGDNLFHSCRCQRLCLQSLALIEQIWVPAVHFQSKFTVVLN